MPILPVLSPRSLWRLSDSRFTMRTVLISCFSRLCINPGQQSKTFFQRTTTLIFHYNKHSKYFIGQQILKSTNEYGKSNRRSALTGKFTFIVPVAAVHHHGLLAGWRWRWWYVFRWKHGTAISHLLIVLYALCKRSNNKVLHKTTFFCVHKTLWQTYRIIITNSFIICIIQKKYSTNPCANTFF